MRFKRVFLIVLDSLGVGAADDAKDYNNEGSNTLKHIIENSKIKIPNMKALGFYNILKLDNIKANTYYTKAKPISNGKDTLVGHYEIIGIKTDIPYKTFSTFGFPKELIKEIEIKTGYKVIGNKVISGPKIINELGVEHIKTKSLIIYTSFDSVLQVAAHENVIPLNELDKICNIIRNITLKEEWKIGRIIARPFTGTPNNFIRTSNRKDYALKPLEKTLLNYLKDAKYDVISIGKIKDIFNNEGFTKHIKTTNNLDGINKLIKIINKDFRGLCFTNLNDFDSLYGHRRDIEGYAKCLEEFDSYVPKILDSLKKDDLIIFTADHGNDPTYIGTDHTRENIPVVLYSKSFINNGQLKTLNTFADIGHTIADNFNVQPPNIGSSFLNLLK